MEFLALVPLVFVAGVASFAAPCFLPIVPVFVTYLVGEQTASPAPTLAQMPSAEGFLPGTPGGSATTRVITPTQAPTTTYRASAKRTAANTLAFIAGFTLVFVSLWGAISAIGWVVGDLRPALRVVGGVVLILLGLVTAGLLRIPALERAWGAPSIPKGAPTLARSALLGLAFGAGWSPCIGPVLGTVLGLAVVSDSALTGVGLLLVYSVGLGLPLLLVALGASSLTEHLSWFARHNRAVRIVSGILLILVGFFMITDLMAPLSSITWFGV